MNVLTEKIFKLSLRFLKDNDILKIYLKEYYTNPNRFNSKNVLKDLKIAIRNSGDGSPFHMRTKGFDRDTSIKGELFWANVNFNFLKILTNNEEI